MHIAKIYEDTIKGLCKDQEYAMALFLRGFTLGDSYDDVLRNADLYGLNKKKFEEVLNIIDDIEQRIDSIQDPLTRVNESIELERILAKVSAECVERFSSELEKISRERIKNLQSLEVEAVKYASYIIKAYMNSHYWIPNVSWISFRDDDILEESLSATLQQLDYKEVRNFALMVTRTFLAKIGIAFYYFSSTKKHDDYNYVIPPYAMKIIDELAKDAENEFKNAINSIVSSNDIMLLNALLIKLNDGDPYIFEAIHGKDLNEYLRTLKFSNVCYYGYFNYSIRNLLNNAVIDLVKNRVKKIYQSIENTLRQKGFDIITVYEPMPYRLYYTILAVKQGYYRVAIHIIPFPYKWPYKEENKEVIILEGPIAIPRVIAKPDGYRNYVVVEMDENFDGIKNVFDYINVDWSKEIAGIFKSLQQLLQQTVKPTISPLDKWDPKVWVGKELYGYKVQSVIASGGNGYVLKAEKDGSPYAIKVFSISLSSNVTVSTSSNFDMMFKESETLKNLSANPKFVRIYGIFIDLNNLKSILKGNVEVYYNYPPAIVMEYMVGGTSLDLAGNPLVYYSTYWPLIVKEIVKEVAGALAFLHSNDFVHLDVKPENILFFRDLGKYSEEIYRNIIGSIRLGDLGSAVRIGEKISQATPGYCPPEQIEAIILGKGADPKMDIFALGMTAYTLLVSKKDNPASDLLNKAIDSYLSGDISGAMKNIQQAKQVLSSWIPSLPQNTPSDLANIIVRSLNVNPDYRPTAEEIVRSLK